MASAFHNRLVGTIILVALAVIFLPDILDGEKSSNKQVFVDIPNRPELKGQQRVEEFPLEQVKQAVNRTVEIVNEPAVDDEATASQLTEEQQAIVQIQSKPDVNDFPIADSTPVEKVSAGWVIQLGSFRHQKNVRELLNKLESAGYRVFTRQVQTSAGELTKVFVGPDLQKGKLQQAIPHLNELTGLKGKISEFTVE